MYKDDPWGNKVPIMSIADGRAADDFLKNHKNIISRVVKVPRNVQSLIEM